MVSFYRIKWELLTLPRNRISFLCSVANPNPDPPDPRVFGTPGSGSISQRYGCADPDPDPHQNVMVPQHWFYVSKSLVVGQVVSSSTDQDNSTSSDSTGVSCFFTVKHDSFRLSSNIGNVCKLPAAFRYLRTLHFSLFNTNK